MSDEPQYGPCMSVLTEKQRRYVFAMASDPFGTPTGWARAAGYSDKHKRCKATAFYLRRDPKIEAAAFELARSIMNTQGAMLAVRGLIDVAKNPAHKHHLRACEMLANRVGLHERVEQHVTVEHRDMSSAELEARIVQLGRKHGLDVQKLLGSPSTSLEERKKFPAPAALEVIDGGKRGNAA